MANIFTNFFSGAKDKLAGKNDFNKAFLQFLGGGYTSYDTNMSTYIDKGYNINPDVYACISQMSVKTASVPYSVKRIKDKKSHIKRMQINTATKGNASIIQQIKTLSLSNKAYESDDLAFPMDEPNATQTWVEIISLYKTYIRLTGNCYFYMLSPKDGMNSGTPVQVYVLPSHLMQIVIKPNADMLTVESPVSHYMLIEGNQYARFEAEDVIHVKLSNPNFDFQGSHLYGQSPLRAALRNLNSQNSALELNVKTLQNGGAFGFIHGKGTALSQDQAASLKERLVEMDNSPEKLSRIAGASGELAFTRISLTTDELKPFDFLKYDQKAICNVLGWSDRLLNNSEGTGLSTVDLNDIRKGVVTDNILPDLVLLQEAFNKEFLPRFKGYEGTFIEWDITELPEMQADMKMLVEQLEKARVTPNEVRTALKYETLNDDGMDVVWMPTNLQRIDDVSAGMFDTVNNQ